MHDALRSARSMAHHVINALVQCLPARQQTAIKEHFELRFWRNVHAYIRSTADAQATAVHERSHYRQFYTSFFDLTDDDYRGADVLDIGCGPMGSLEWAGMARRRVGLDPLARHYLAMGASAHEMEYVEGAGEALPFPDASFDVVASFNNLDHVADVARSIAEMLRVARPGGTILLITEIGHAPTFTEPHRLDRSVLDHFGHGADLVSERVFGVRGDHNLYASLMEGTPARAGWPGILCARFRRA